MNNKTKNTAVPELRFPEFQGTEEWEEGKLKEVLLYESSALALNKLEFSNEGYPVYGADGLLGRINFFKQDERYIAILKDGSGVGRISIHPSNSSVLGTLGYLKPRDKETSDTLWLYFLLQTIDFSTYVKGSGIPHLYYSDYSEHKVAIPLPAEQQKIADCLSSLDELIAARSAKLEALKAHKRGLMQALFPAEGETVPKLRFPEFQSAGAWAETTVGTICKSFSGGTPSTTQKNYYGGDIPFIRSAEIDKEKTELFLTEEGLANSSAKLVAKGDILFALYGANSGDVAISKQEGAINQAILCLRAEENNVFVFHFLTSRKDWIIKKYLQGGQGNLSGEIVKSIEIFLPLPAEQQKIADCLSSLDHLIAAQAQHLEALKRHKKGLMQGLFPPTGHQQT